MLSLQNISKEYYIGKKGTPTYQVVQALKNVSINFRKHEFVAILGQSGCGKTTLLNIIGGLDKYTSGDLKINNKSTKEFKDRDWDNYRNHSIGFVFQSYNLIPHLSILANVELALTLSGVSKEERKKKAIEALTKVGLKDKIYSKPNQLSGGQMQRVAIARALVNDPEIILADEPTGALDSATSVQVMDLLKEISQNKLIIMVTHNPELAKLYATRTIELFDGKVKSDSNPLVRMPPIKEKKTNGKRPHMSFFTALSLSVRNLLTKKARTFLVSFAGSIGIIGIAAILSMSSGFQAYIDRVQEETLSSYPISLTSETNDMSSLIEMFTKVDEDPDHELDAVYSNNIMSKLRAAMQNSIRVNNLKAFKEYLETDAEVGEVISSANIKYYYDLDIQMYKSDDHNRLLTIDPMGSSSNVMYSSMEIWSQMIDNDDLIKKQYDIVEGALPTKYDEIAIVLDENNEITDLTLYTLGLITREQYQELLNNENAPAIKISYDTIMNNSYVMFPNSDYYKMNGDKADNMRNDSEYLETVFNNNERVINLRVSGIIKPKKESVGKAISGTVAYRSSLITNMIDRINDSKVVKYQKEHPTINVFTGNEFTNKEYKKADVINYLESIINDSQNKSTYANYIYDGLGRDYINLFENNSEENVKTTLTVLIYNAKIRDTYELARLYANKLYDMYVMGKTDSTYTDNLINILVTSVLKSQLDDYFDKESYEKNLKTLGVCDISSPSRIDLYAYDFANKEAIVDMIDKYNDTSKATLGNDDNVINYTDYVGLIMSSVSMIIDIISIVLIVFVSISLVVSSIMIGVITYISVLERIKEIGILRAIGASKRDIKRVFTAESISIGFFSGTIGIIVTCLIIIPANLILKGLTNISNLAVLPIGGAIILIAISVLMTFIAGLIPAQIASKKDPVVALRTE